MIKPTQEERDAAVRMFEAHNRGNGALYPGGFGFMSESSKTPWYLLARQRIALQLMVAAFEPFRSKPMGAPNSDARVQQEAQIAAHTKAMAALEGRSE